MRAAHRHHIREAGLRRDFPKLRSAVLHPAVQKHPVPRLHRVCADNEIHAPVAIQIPKRRAARPVLRVEWRMLEHRRKLHSLAIPVPRLTDEQPVAVPDEEIRAPVFVHIRHREPETKNVRRQPCRLAGVCKLQSAEIVHQHRARSFCELVLDEQKIQQPVRIEIQHAHIAGREQRLRAGAARCGNIREPARVVAKQLAPLCLRRLLRVPARVLFRIVRHVKFQRPVVVEVGKNRSARSRRHAQSGHVHRRKLPAAVISK